MSVYGGGHSVTGAAVIDDGLMIDMRGMKAIAVDADARTVRAEAGLNWGEFDAATQEHGLAVTGGRVPDTGIVGLALGSGSGWLERKLGFTCDNLIGAEMVTADGRGREGDRHRERRPVLGPPGWRRQLRDRHRRVPPAPPDRTDRLRRDAGVAGRYGGRRRAVLAGLHARRTRRGGQRAGVHHRATGRVRARARARPPDHRAASAATRATPPKATKAMAPLREFGPPGLDLFGRDPVHRGAGPHHRGQPARAAQLLVRRLPRRAARRSGRRARREGHEAGVTVQPRSCSPPAAARSPRVPDEATAFGERHSPFNTHYLSMWEDPADDERNIALHARRSRRR